MVRRKKIAEAIRVWQGKSTPKISKKVNTHIKTPTAFNQECSTLKPRIEIPTEQIRARLRQRKNKSFKSVNELGITLQAVKARIEAKESILTEELPSPQPLLPPLHTLQPVSLSLPSYVSLPSPQPTKTDTLEEIPANISLPPPPLLSASPALQSSRTDMTSEKIRARIRAKKYCFDQFSD
ncbi:hypothetical protein QAD02_003267 [Eretmocerus hayati]|uniref:Uncharacterized protein n=1 Tax=Eretmocerus hayati TaxID=131215 RepID=A0ACC2NLC3_9HYME|nr:hypothetical protein QAD02_003267 [Eretmocerus hayati]